MIDVAIRVGALLAAAWLVTALMRRAAASTRHLVWTAAVVGALVLPVCAAILPAWPLPLPTSSAAFFVSSAKALRYSDGAEASLYDPPRPPQRPDDAAAVAQRFSAATPTAPGVSAADLQFLNSSWLLIAWAAVAGLLLVRVGAGIVAVQRLARHAHPAHPRWRSLLDIAARDLAVTGSVRVVVSDDVTMPMTAGGRHAVLLLPLAAHDWSDDRARVVLLHELAHIARRDWTTHLAARVLAALHWYNPLAWMAVRRMTAERERACDDCVLAHGAAPSDYASHLLDIARAQPSWRFGAAAALAMARASELEGRLLGILESRARTTTRRAARSATAVLVVLTCAIASATPRGSAAISPSAQAQPAPAAPAAASVVPSKPVHLPKPRLVPNVPGLDLPTDRDAVRAFDRALDDPSPSVRERAVMNLSAVNDAAVIGPLIEALRDEDAQVREKAAIGLALRSESRVVDPLLAALGDESAQVREKAAIGLAFRRQPAVVDALIKAADDEDSQVREKVILALGLSGDRRAVPTIVAATKDSDRQVREQAIESLRMAHDGGDAIDGEVARDRLRRGVGGVLRLFGAGR